MHHPYAHHVAHRPVWATPLATVVLWTAVIAFAVAGAVTIPFHGDAGAVLLVAALIVAAPAAAASHYRSDR
ncbi:MULTISPECIES: hypothetical protein [Microbacterium]|uniref:hypothetical protein n=1 Tax=Microbacterium TaxID=33882 RepID=UPI00277F7369|nr:MULTISPECIES: hypothetical protein [Microbacterium]MDQ1083862.1 hypothetical protein [Microbacterium sp. SORGH_AS_0344]MDQ1170859.1 hypothetical protein [Microbacterium proteolyticum]